MARSIPDRWRLKELYDDAGIPPKDWRRKADRVQRVTWKVLPYFAAALLVIAVALYLLFN